VQRPSGWLPALATEALKLTVPHQETVERKAWGTASTLQTSLLHSLVLQHVLELHRRPRLGRDRLDPFCTVTWAKGVAPRLEAKSAFSSFRASGGGSTAQPTRKPGARNLAADSKRSTRPCVSMLRKLAPRFCNPGTSPAGQIIVSGIGL